MSLSISDGHRSRKQSTNLAQQSNRFLRSHATRWRKAPVVEQHALSRSLEPNALEDSNSDPGASRLRFPGFDFSCHFGRGGESHVGRDHRGLHWMLCRLGLFDYLDVIELGRRFPCQYPVDIESPIACVLGLEAASRRCQCADSTFGGPVTYSQPKATGASPPSAQRAANRQNAARIRFTEPPVVFPMPGQSQIIMRTGRFRSRP